MPKIIYLPSNLNPETYSTALVLEVEIQVGGLKNESSKSKTWRKKKERRNVKHQTTAFKYEALFQ